MLKKICSKIKEQKTEGGIRQQFLNIRRQRGDGVLWVRHKVMVSARLQIGRSC